MHTNLSHSVIITETKRSDYDFFKRQNRTQGGVLFKLIAVSTLLLFAATSCTQYSLLPFPPYWETTSHEHQWSDEPMCYELKGNTVYAVYKCLECNETKETIAYNNAAIPDEGEVGDLGDDAVVVVTPETAQAVLDNIGDNSFVIFSPGVYEEELKIITSITQSEVMIQGDFSGTEEERYMPASEFLEYETTSPDDLWKRGLKVYRELSDVTLYALDGAVFPGGFSITLDSTYDYIREKDSYKLNDKNEKVGDGTYLPYILVNNLTIENWTFDKSNIVVSFQRPHETESTRFELGLFGLNVKNCRFEGDSAITQNANDVDSQAITTADNISADTFSNLSVEGCTFNEYYQGIYTGTMNNAEVKDSVFTDIIHNAIAFQGSAGTNAAGKFVDTRNTGTFTIQGNTFQNVSDRAIGRGGFIDADILIAENTFIDSGDTNGELIKFGNNESQTLTNVVITLQDNTNNGSVMENITVPIGYKISWSK